MNVSSSLALFFAVIMGALAVYDSLRLAVSSTLNRDRVRSNRRVPGRIQMDVDLFHAIMGAAMVTMLLGHLSPFAIDLLAIVFGCYSCWFVARIPWEVAGGCEASAARTHWVSHATAGAAMVYMLIAMPATASGSAMAAMTSAGSGYRVPTLGVAIACVLVFEGAIHLRQLIRQVGKRRPDLLGEPRTPDQALLEPVIRLDDSGHSGVAVLERVHRPELSQILVRSGTFLLRNELSEICQITMSVVMAILLIAR